MTQKKNESQQLDNKVLPVMQEAILTVRMILHRHLVDELATRQTQLTSEERVLLSGAVINNLFGTRPENDAVVHFAKGNRALVEEELRGLASHCPAKLLPVLTDSLRMQTICDEQIGIRSVSSLLMAKALGLLQEERPLPMPSTFMLAVRNLAVGQGLVEKIMLLAEGDAD
jgi:hypothetical protein